MRHRAFGLIVALLLVCVPLRADDLVPGLFRTYLESLRKQAGIPGLAAAIVGENDILWEVALGQQNIERSVATRADTPFHTDGLTQVFTAAMVLRCVEDGKLSLDQRLGEFKPGSPDADATIAQALSHTSGAPGSLTYAYRPERLDPLTVAVRRCTDNSYRESLANLLERFGMMDSVPGADIVTIAPPAEGVPDPVAVARYTRVLARLATPYAVDRSGRSSPSEYAATTITPASGLITTVRDFARFDVALREGVLLQPETLAAAWRAPLDRAGRPLPHGLGWFVQAYNGEPIVWQFGVAESASSSIVVTVPGRRLTLILLANSDGLVKPFQLASGDVTASPFAKLFLGLFVR